MKNNLPADFNKRFLTNTDDTGRFIVVSERTGKKYYVEPIGDPHIKWGSIDPVTKNLTNKKGHGKYTGSISEEESLITEENGFTNITMAPIGMSPFAIIEELDSKYPSKKK